MEGIGLHVIVLDCNKHRASVVASRSTLLYHRLAYLELYNQVESLDVNKFLETPSPLIRHMNTTMSKLKSENCTYDWNISFDEKLILRNVCFVCSVLYFIT